MHKRGLWAITYGDTVNLICTYTFRNTSHCFEMATKCNFPEFCVRIIFRFEIHQPEFEKLKVLKNYDKVF